MAPHSSTLAWNIPWMEEPGRLHAVHGIAKSRTRMSDFSFTFHFHALEKEMATHSSVLAWRIPGMGEPGGLPSMGLHRVGHDWSDLAAAAAAAARSTIMPGTVFQMLHNCLLLRKLSCSNTLGFCFFFAMSFCLLRFALWHIGSLLGCLKVLANYC